MESRLGQLKQLIEEYGDLQMLKVQIENSHVEEPKGTTFVLDQIREDVDELYDRIKKLCGEVASG